MIRVGTSSQQLVDIHNSDQLLLLVAGSAETTTRATGASVVLAAAAHFRVALQDQELWVKETQAVTPLVAEVAQLAAAAGIGGCVCSPLEVAALRAAQPEPFALVTPGIRPAGAALGDQQRVLTPAQAVAAGASQLVIGRPITAAPDPGAAFAACCRELLGHHA